MVKRYISIRSQKVQSLTRTQDLDVVRRYLQLLPTNFQNYYNGLIANDYLSGLAELEIAANIVSRGKVIVLNPSIGTANLKHADIKTSISGRDLFAEITVIRDLSSNIVLATPTRYKHAHLLQIPVWEIPSKREVGVKYLLDKIVNKITEETYQLPDYAPTILVIDIEDPGVSIHDVEDSILGFPSYIIQSDTAKLKVQREEFLPFRTIEELLGVLDLVSCCVVYEYGRVREGNIYFNDVNSRMPLNDNEKNFITDLIRNFV